MTRHVKLGRTGIGEYEFGQGLFAKHWAVQVGNCWYEIAGRGEKKGGANKIEKSCGAVAASGAGRFGGEVVGKTDKEAFINFVIRRTQEVGEGLNLALQIAEFNSVT